MSRVLCLTVSALLLAGCADVYDRTAEIPPCKRLVRMDHAISPMSLPGLVMSDVSVILGGDLGGSGKLDMEWANSPGCIRQEDKGTKSPKLYDLRKIGIAI